MGQTFSNFQRGYSYEKRIFLTLALALTTAAFLPSTQAAPRTSANLTTGLISDVDKAENQAVPIGTVIAWPYNSLPADGDWLECNGGNVSVKDYPEFVAKFGSKTPNYQGMFLRGYGGNSGLLGEEQNWSMPDTFGKGYINGLMGVWPATWMNGVFTMVGSYGWGHAWGGGSDIGVNIEFDLANSVPAENRANEMRPVNKAVKYIIKAR